MEENLVRAGSKFYKLGNFGVKIKLQKEKKGVLPEFLVVQAEVTILRLSGRFDFWDFLVRTPLLSTLV